MSLPSQSTFLIVPSFPGAVPDPVLKPDPPQLKDQITIPKGMLALETSARKFHFPVSLNEKRLLSLEQLAVGDDDGAVRVAARGQSSSGSPNSDRHAADGTMR